MAEHSDLISEMPYLEKLNTEERLKLARKRRSQQLKKWSQREKEYSLVNKRKRSEAVAPSNVINDTKSGKNGYKIHFVPSVMLLEAATRNDIDEVKRLLMLGVSPDSTNEDGLTALHQCCIDNCEEMMRLLIEFGANVNAKDSEQWTPLHAAATCGHLHLIKLLIEKDADLLAVNADGNMPYDICEDEQTLDYIEAEMAKRGITQELIDQIRVKTEQQMLFDMKELVQNGYDINYKDEQGATPLHIAAANCYMSVIEFLVDSNASVDVYDNDMWQPIHAAACWGHIDVVEFLVQNGADLEAKTKNGETPFDICEDPDLKSRILQLKSEIDAKKAISSTRLRRSHSTNTRSHSIRRTSIREKSQIAKREAIEEARIWHGKTSESMQEIKKDDTDIIDSDGQFHNDFNRKLFTDPPIDINSINVKIDNSNNFDDDQYHPNRTVQQQHYHILNENDNNQMDTSRTTINNNINNISNNSKSNNSMLGQVTYHNHSRNAYDQSSDQYYGVPNQNNENLACSNMMMNMDINIQQNEISNSSANNNNNSNNNHNNKSHDRNTEMEVSNDPYLDFGFTNAGNGGGNNNTNSCTLMDLKKQRSEKHRTSLSNVYSDRIKSFVDYSHNSPLSNNIPLHNNQMNYDSMVVTNNSGGGVKPSIFDSPNTVRKKFRGNPSELIGEDDKQGCCIIC